MALATFTITNDGQFLLITSTETGSIESLSLTEIKDITCTRVAPMVGTYPYVDMNMLTVEINGRSADLTFDLATVTNQVGWTLDLAGCNQAQADIRGWAASSGGTVGGATEATLLLVEANTAADATVLVSSSTTGAGTIPAGSKAATIVIVGSGATINLVVRPDGWSQSFEFNNDTLPAIPYNGNGATMYVDILT